MKKIVQRDSTLTESELQTVVASAWLRIGVPCMKGGELLSKWLEEHLADIESIFGSEDRVYIRTKTPQANKELAEFVNKNKIGDELQWIKCKESDRWWLMVWWE